MCTNVYARATDVNDREIASPEEGEERFAERRRIVLMEPDAALRSVLVRTLLRLGCIVRFTRSLESFVEALQDDEIDGVVVALDDLLDAVSLHKANRRQVPVVVLAYAPPDPYLIERLPTVRFVQKPFDVGELLTHLHLPESAKIIRAG